MTKQHRWTHPTPRVRSDGERIEEGDIFRPTVHEKRVWPERMEPQATCAGMKNNGRPCTRPVDEEGTYCWQHQDSDSDEEQIDANSNT